MVLGMLMMQLDLSMKFSLELIRERHPGSNLNPKFKRILKEMEDKIIEVNMGEEEKKKQQKQPKEDTITPLVINKEKYKKKAIEMAKAQAKARAKAQFLTNSQLCPS